MRFSFSILLVIFILMISELSCFGQITKTGKENDEEWERLIKNKKTNLFPTAFVKKSQIVVQK